MTMTGLKRLQRNEKLVKNSMFVLLKKCMPEKHKDVQKFNKHRELLIRELCHQNKMYETHLKNMCLKNIRTYKNLLRFVFC